MARGRSRRAPRSGARRGSRSRRAGGPSARTGGRSRRERDADRALRLLERGGDEAPVVGAVRDHVPPRMVDALAHLGCHPRAIASATRIASSASRSWSRRISAPCAVASAVAASVAAPRSSAPSRPSHEPARIAPRIVLARDRCHHRSSKLPELGDSPHQLDRVVRRPCRSPGPGSIAICSARDAGALASARSARRTTP